MRVRDRPLKELRFHRNYGPWAVVTGASDGIGRATCHQLAALGLNVVLAARSRARLTTLARELESAHPVQCQVVVVDLATRDAPAKLDRETAALDVGLLVAAAGFGSLGDLLSRPMEDELEMVQVNVAATLELSHRFGRRLAGRGGGGIILFSSVVAFQGVPGSANYAATKAYVQSLAEGLNAELEPRGVHVLACAPGPVHSGFAGRAGMHMGRALSPESVVVPMLDALGRRRTVRPGWLSKLLGWSLAGLPRAGRTQVLARVMQGMAPPPPESDERT